MPMGHGRDPNLTLRQPSAPRQSELPGLVSKFPAEM